MKIKKIIDRNRRDFTAIYECEHCRATEERGGYDDSYFHDNVIPKMECPKCKKTAPVDYQPMATRYPDNMVV